jgi:hypothetical protein
MKQNIIIAIVFGVLALISWPIVLLSIAILAYDYFETEQKIKIEKKLESDTNWKTDVEAQLKALKTHAGLRGKQL